VMLRQIREALAQARGPPGNKVRSAIRNHNALIVDAEYQLAFGHSLAEMRHARDNLRTAMPNCPLLEALEEKITRTKATERLPFGPWGRII